MDVFPICSVFIAVDNRTGELVLLKQCDEACAEAKRAKNGCRILEDVTTEVFKITLHSAKHLSFRLWPFYLNNAFVLVFSDSQPTGSARMRERGQASRGFRRRNAQVHRDGVLQKKATFSITLSRATDFLKKKPRTSSASLSVPSSTCTTATLPIATSHLRTFCWMPTIKLNSATLARP